MEDPAARALDEEEALADSGDDQVADHPQRFLPRVGALSGDALLLPQQRSGRRVLGQETVLRQDEHGGILHGDGTGLDAALPARRQ